MRGIGVVAGVTVWMMLAGCGEPRGGVRPFEFEPYPYTVEPVPKELAGCEICSRYVAIDGDGHQFAADQVLLVVEAAEVEAITGVAESLEFEVLRSEPESGSARYLMLVRAPPGAAIDAVEFFARQQGVVIAEKNAVLRSDTAGAE
jgi:hypothetical protein